MTARGRSVRRTAAGTTPCGCPSPARGANHHPPASAPLLTSSGLIPEWRENQPPGMTAGNFRPMDTASKPVIGGVVRDREGSGRGIRNGRALHSSAFRRGRPQGVVPASKTRTNRDAPRIPQERPLLGDAPQFVNRPFWQGAHRKPEFFRKVTRLPSLRNISRAVPLYIPPVPGSESRERALSLAASGRLEKTTPFPGGSRWMVE